MEDTSKYLIHARITADGVVERSDVVGAVFGQTEGLLGDELDLRDLQQSSKIGRIDVEIDSEHGQSFGTITITSSLDKVETAILAASLEAITRVGPCEARVEVADIEDMRAAKRREVVERAKQLLAESFDDSVMDSTEILEEVREAQRVERIDDYAGYPAGPRVDNSDAIIVVEGRSDVLTLLEYGIKNAIAVEGTNVPTEVADLTQERTVTAFLDGDRGGDLILRELAQVADVDYVAFAPDGKSVEDLARGEVMNALREKAPFDTLDPASDHGTEPAATDGSARPAPSDTAGDPHSTPDSPTAPNFETEPTDSTGSETETDGRDDDGVPLTEESVGESSADGPAAERDSRAATGSVRTNSAHTTDPVGGVGEHSAPEETDPTADTETPETDASDAGDAGDATDDVDTDSESDSDSESESVGDGVDTDAESESVGDDEDTEPEPESVGDDEDTEPEPESVGDDADTETESTSDDTQSDDTTTQPTTLRGHIQQVIDGGSKRARLLDDSYEAVADVPSGEAFDTLADGETTGFVLVIDGQLDQRLLDVAAQRGVEQIVATTEGEFVKRPASVRVVTADRFASA